jgi:hypothetical protein
MLSKNEVERAVAEAERAFAAAATWRESLNEATKDESVDVAAVREARRAVTVAADWLSLLMIHKPIALDESADERAEADAAMARMTSGARVVLNKVKQQARSLKKDVRRIDLCGDGCAA